MRLRIEQDYWLFGIYNNLLGCFRTCCFKFKTTVSFNWKLRDGHLFKRNTREYSPLMWKNDVYSSQQRSWPSRNVIMNSRLTAVTDSPLTVLSFLISKETAPVRQQHRWGLCATSIVFTSGSNKALHAGVKTQYHTLLASFYHSKLCITS